MSRPFVPHEYQRLAMDFLLATPRGALYADMGMGKTGSTLSALETLKFAGFDDPILVMAPRRVAKDTWPDEIAKWDHTKHLTIAPIVGTPEQRMAALRRKADIHSVNYEQLPWLIDQVGAEGWRWKAVIADESPVLKGMRTRGQGGLRTNRLAEVARIPDYWWNLSGTPCPNGLKDLWRAPREDLHGLSGPLVPAEAQRLRHRANAALRARDTRQDRRLHHVPAREGLVRPEGPPCAKRRRQIAAHSAQAVQAA